MTRAELRARRARLRAERQRGGEQRAWFVELLEVVVRRAKEALKKGRST